MGSLTWVEPDVLVKNYLHTVTEWTNRPFRKGPEYARRSITFSEFRQVVRRFRPSDLLPALASLAVQIGDPPYQHAVLNSAAPWAIAIAARESIIYGNEHRSPGVSTSDLITLFNAHNEIYEAELREGPVGLLAILTRIAYEQFPYQESVFEEISRTHAVLGDCATVPGLEVLGSPVGEALFGAPLGEVVGATFFLYAAAYGNYGWFDLRWLDREDLHPVFDRWPRDVIQNRLQQLSCTFKEFREDYESQQHPPVGFERYAFNPLVARPFVQMPNGGLLAPQPRLILRTISLGGLYYPGVRKLGTSFARDLGRLIERYVGDQLQSISPNIEIHPEITYGRQNVKSIDWFLVLPNVVVMFEVKSARFALLERAAAAGFEDRVRALLNKAMKQLRTTSEAVDAGVQEFASIPADRPRVGVIVTAEPHYLANTPWARIGVQPPPFPTVVASLRDVEELVCLPLDLLGQELVRIANDPEQSTWSLGTALERVNIARRNSILDRAWAAYPWPERVDDGAPGGVAEVT